MNFKLGLQKKLFLGNLYAERDWGHARDYVKMQWLMLQKSTPDDFVIASGSQYTVKDFVNRVCSYLDLNIKWVGKDLKEKGIVNGKVFIEIKKKFFQTWGGESVSWRFDKSTQSFGMEKQNFH